jgi:low affinity Fe/Cu permease
LTGLEFYNTAITTRAARASSRPETFGVAATIIPISALTGLMLGLSETWQLAINTATTTVTFLMVFLMQNTQDRATYALQAKLDELMRAMEGAHAALLELEELDEVHLDRIQANHKKGKATYALQVKLDGLIRAMEGAHAALLELDEVHLGRIQANHKKGKYKD